MKESHTKKRGRKEKVKEGKEKTKKPFPTFSLPLTHKIP
jgi:hypothetical protein